MVAKFVIALAVVGCVSGFQQKREDNNNAFNYEQYLNQFGKPFEGSFPGGYPQMPNPGQFPSAGQFPTFGGNSSPAPSKRQIPSEFTDYNKFLEGVGANWPAGMPNPGSMPNPAGSFPQFGGSTSSSSGGSSASTPSKRQTIPNEYTNPNKWIEGFQGNFPTGVPNPGQVGNFPGVQNPFTGSSSSSSTTTTAESS